MFNTNAESLSVRDTIGFNGIVNPNLSINEEQIELIDHWLEDNDNEWEYVWSAGGGRALGMKIENTLLSKIAREGTDAEREAARWLHDTQSRDGWIKF